MNEDQLRGHTDRGSGNIKEGLGDLSGDEKLQKEGQGEQLGGTASKTFGDVKEGVGDAVDNLRKDR